MTATTRPATGQPATAGPSRGAAIRLVVAQTALVGVDAVGGVLAVATGINTWAEAWGPTALLAAPLPMVAGQAVLAYLAVATQRRWGAVPAGLLALACFVSIASGFFDGGIGNARLGAWSAAYQVLLLAVTGVVGLLALARARELTHGSRRP
jgi:hypothetical protein